MRNDERRIAISMKGISKRFGPVQALAEADLEVECGTIHGLVGQNGAGKSTIIKVLAGINVPDAGEIHVMGERVERLTPARVEALGVHFIHQDRLLVPTATVGEAVFLRHEPRIGPFVSKRRMERCAADLLKKYFDLELPHNLLVQDLTTAQQKIVQITRALRNRRRCWCSTNRPPRSSRKKWIVFLRYCGSCATTASRSFSSRTTCRKSNPCATR